MEVIEVAILVEAVVVMFFIQIITLTALCVLSYILAAVIDETKTFGHSSMLDRLTKRE